MGREVARAVAAATDVALVGGADPGYAGSDLAQLAELAPKASDTIEYRTVYRTLDEAIPATAPHVVVDFTTPSAVYDNVLTALKHGVHVVFGTTGLSADQLADIDHAAKEMGLGVIHAPNFAIGAVLLMRFAAVAAVHFPSVEVIELHHDRKRDAPSGTAVKTAQMIAEARRAAGLPEIRSAVEEEEIVTGARGGRVESIPVHSVRLPGLVAHQEVILGGPGQTLTIRHDSLHRESFMPGVLLAVRKVRDHVGLVYGLEHLLSL